MKNKNLSDLEPQLLWQLFEKICHIPHPSEHEQALSQFIQDFGKDLGLETLVDEVGNIIIRKPATPGKENSPIVILQSHLDMVPQKDSDVAHDFEKDPIHAYIDGEWVAAKGTTLGADDGVGIALILAILTSKDLTHGPIEALFTASEEVGMLGASQLKPDVLTGEMLINLDGEIEGAAYVGCSGGIIMEASLTYQSALVPNDVKAYCIEVGGLKGGHSGADIHHERGNAIKIINRLLWRASRDYQLRVADLEGGTLHNAIPREALAMVIVPEASADEFILWSHQFIEQLKSELAIVDPGLTVTIEPTDLPVNVMDQDTQNKFLNAIYACPHGILGMSHVIPGLVETSNNLAKISMKDETIHVIASQRGSLESLKYVPANMMRSIFELIGGKITINTIYPAWPSNPDTKIATVFQKVYQEKFGKPLAITAVHAGLECAILGSTYPQLSMISLGPTIEEVHTPNERVNIESVNKLWILIAGVLEQV